LNLRQAILFRQRSASRVGRIAARRAFTLLEVLVVIAVIAVLLGLLSSALSASRRAALNLRCISQMQSVAFEFRLFADDFTARNRGESEQLGPDRFYVDDFQDSMYRIDEFWDAPPLPLVPYQGREPMMCPAGPDDLSRRPGLTAFQGALWPPKNVSLAFNRRLWRDGINPGITQLSSRVLSYPNAPLLIDVDGEKAVAAGHESTYTAPPVDGIADLYSTGQYWYPSMRHGNRLNVAFIGGHVASSKSPLSETSWRWGYVP
jgi:prepilin-type N-terminal cleavage/methylation domain-containing protein/prepilin-type processing-associated H-X9-DG protein